MVEKPPDLWDEVHWELKGRADSPTFFRLLQGAFPQATTLFVEGEGRAPDVVEFLHAAAEPGPYLPPRQTLLPKSTLYRLPVHGPTLAALADLAERHADPELLDHLSVYHQDRPLLQWHDAFSPDCPALVSMDADPDHLRAFAAALGMVLSRRDPS